jgi:hypothetical protein
MPEAGVVGGGVDQEMDVPGFRNVGRIAVNHAFLHAEGPYNGSSSIAKHQR